MISVRLSYAADENRNTLARHGRGSGEGGKSVDRRQLLGVIASATAYRAGVARAQEARVRRIGALIGLASDDPDGQARIAAFLQAMRKLGWSEGSNLQTDIRWAGPDADRIRQFGEELVNAGPDVILAVTSPSVAALKRATGSIPIVFANIGDPVGQGFVASLARPGSNITGFTGLEYSVGGRWVGVLKEVAPRVAQASYLFHPEIGPYYPLFLKSVEAAGATFGIGTVAVPVHTDKDIENAIRSVAATPNAGLIVQPDSFTQAKHKLIIALASQYSIPTVYPYRYEVAAGGLVSYGPDVLEIFRRSATYVDRLLKGEKPADLPVQQPLKYELVLNLKVAKALGLSVPETLSSTADEVFE
jgi:putative ABC transport system substrate-binding protein